MERAAIFETALVLSLILLGAALYVGIANNASAGGGNWSNALLNATPYMYAGSDGTLYIFDVAQDGTHIYVVGKDGGLNWSYLVPWDRTVVHTWERKAGVVSDYDDSGEQICSESDTRPVFTVAGGVMYLYLAGDQAGDGEPYQEEVMAVADGHLLWEHRLIGDRYFDSLMDASIQAYGDRLYVYHSYSLDVIGTNGTGLYAIPAVSDPPALDEDGNSYLSTAVQSPHQALAVFGFMAPSGIVESYSPDGTLRWKTTISETPARQDIDRTAVPDGGDLPIYRDGLLYVPQQQGLTVLYLNGSVAWKASVGDNVSLLEEMPFGSGGAAYMARSSYDFNANRTPVVYTIAPGGTFTAACPSAGDMELLAASQGVGYYGNSRSDEDYLSAVEDLLPVNITAIDLSSGNVIWNSTVYAGEPATVVADAQNVGRLFEYDTTAGISIGYTEDHPELLNRTGLMLAVLGNADVNAVAAGNVIYVSYYLYNYEHPEGYWNGTTYTPLFRFSGSEDSAENCPALLGRSRICYASGVAALDASGTILWNHALDSMLTGIAAGNATVYYGTRGGGLSVVRSNAAIGVTVTVALYLFLRFFMVGAVARARSRIDGNKNRNLVLELVRKEPGNTMYELARQLGMNVGTVRYHLLILGLNHRVATFRDGKYVRYFGNANAYSESDRAIISLLRRDWARGMLSALLERGGMSNGELARALDISEPAISGCVRDLMEKGLVTRSTDPAGNVSYVIRDDRREQVARALHLLPAPRSR